MWSVQPLQLSEVAKLRRDGARELILLKVPTMINEGLGRHSEGGEEVS